MTLENKYNRGTHGDSSHMLSTVVLSNENQTCRGWEAPTSTGGGGCHLIIYPLLRYKQKQIHSLQYEELLLQSYQTG